MYRKHHSKRRGGHPGKHPKGAPFASGLIKGKKVFIKKSKKSKGSWRKLKTTKKGIFWTSTRKSKSGKSKTVKHYVQKFKKGSKKSRKSKRSSRKGKRSGCKGRKGSRKGRKGSKKSGRKGKRSGRKGRKGSKKSGRKGRKGSRRARRFGFGGFAGGFPTTLMDMEGPYP